tara:strand:+ start:692 stop:922 length:231 start_codon:yes stop_codon:yes gene_type:complete
MNHQPTRRQLILREWNKRVGRDLRKARRRQAFWEAANATINTALDCFGAAVILGGGLFIYCFGEELLNILADFTSK